MKLSLARLLLDSKCLTAVALALVLPGLSAQAQITWGPARNISATNDVVTNGTLVYAYNWANRDEIVNGVPFAAANSRNAGGNVGTTMTSVNTSVAWSSSAAFSALSQEYTNILVGAIYLSSSAAQTVTLSNLVNGRSYLVQFWVNDPRANTYTRTDNLSSPGGNSVLLRFAAGPASGNPGQFAVGVFTASGTTQSITVVGTSGSVPSLNAIQLRDITGFNLWGGYQNSTWDYVSQNWGTGQVIDTNPAVAFADTNALGAAITANVISVQPAGVTNGAPGLVSFLNDVVNYTIQSDAGTPGLSGLRSVNLLGSGTVTFTGPNTYTGSTSIRSGTLALSGGGVLGNGTYAGGLVNNGAFNYNSAAAQTLSGAISGTGTFTQNGPGALTLSGVNTYSGDTIVNGGQLVAVTGGSCSRSSVAVAKGGASFGVRITDTAKVWSCTNLAFAAAGTLDFNFGNLVPSATVAPLVVSNVAAFTVTPDVIVRGGMIGALPAGSYPLMTWGSVLGAVPVTVALPPRAGAANLSVVGKTLYLTITTPGNAPLFWAAGSGTWDIGLTSNWKDAANNLTTYQESIWGNDLVVFNDGEGGPGENTVTLPANVAPTSVSFSNTATAYTLSGSGAITGSVGLIKNGTNSLTLANTNAYTGATTIGSGALALSGTGVLGNGTYAGAIVNNGALRYLSSAPQTLSGVISGAGSLTQNGLGTLTLGARNTYTGPTLVNSGMLVLANGNSSAGALAGSAITVMSGAELDLNYTDALGYGNTNPIVIYGTVKKVNNQAETLYRPMIFANGTLTNTLTSDYYAYNTFGNFILTAANTTNLISGPGALGLRTSTFYFTNEPGSVLNITAEIYPYTSGCPLNKRGPGQMVLSATNGYNGPTVISDGTLVISGAGKLDSSGTGTGNTYGANITINGLLVFNTSEPQALSGPISGSGTLVQRGSGTLQIGDGVADQPVTCAISNQATLAFYVANTNNFDGLLTSTGLIEKQGSGALTLAGANMIAGPVKVAGGTLTCTTSNTLAGPLTVNDATLGVKRMTATDSLQAASVDLNYATVNLDLNFKSLNNIPLVNITGAMTNSGMLTINLNNVNHSGLTVGTYPLIRYGTLVDGGGSWISSAVNIPSVTGTIQDDPVNKRIVLEITDVSYLKWTGAVNNLWDTTTANWADGSLAATYSDGQILLFDETAASTSIDTGLYTTYQAAAILVTNSSKTYALTNTAFLGGNGSLIKQGPGTLVLANSYNGYAGGTIISGGTLQVGDGTAEPGLGSGDIQNDGMLLLNVATYLTSPPISGTGSLTKQGLGTLSLPGVNNYGGSTVVSEGTLALTEAGQLGGGTYSMPIINNGTISIASSAAQVLSGVISGTGTLNKSGSGALTLSNANTYAGGSSLDAGVVSLASPETAGVSGPLGTATAVGSISLGGAMLRHSSVNQYDYSSRFSTADNQRYDIDTAGQDVTWATALTSSGASLTKRSSGKLTLTGDNTFSGAANCTGGTLNFGGGSWTNENASTFKTLMVSGSGTNLINNHARIVVAGWVSVATGNDTIGTMILESGDLTINTSGSGGSPGDRALVIGEYPGSMGTFNMNGGTLTATNAAVYVSQSSGGNPTVGIWNMNGGVATVKKITFGYAAPASGTLNLNGGTLAIGSGGITRNQTAVLNLAGGTLAAWEPWTSSLAINFIGAGPTLDTTSGDIVLTGVLSGNGGLTKAGSGTLTLGAANTYTGSTLINNGILALSPNGELPASALIEVRAPAAFDVTARADSSFTLGGGQTLQGNGTIKGSLSAVGTVAPGASVGKLTVTTNLILGGSATTVIEVDNAAGSNDVLVVGGTLTCGGTLVITNVSGVLYTNNQVLKVFEAGTYAPSSFASISMPGVSAYDASNLAVDGTIRITSVSPPLPTTPTSITFSAAEGGTQLHLTWPSEYTGWLLQSNSVSVDNPNAWFNVPGSEATNQLFLEIDQTEASIFYRMRFP